MTRTRRRRRSMGWWSLTALALATSVACGGGDEGVDVDTPQAPGAGPGAVEAPDGATTGPLTTADLSPSLIALGDSVFSGRAGGGICYTCHGPEAEGSQIAPNLVDREWLHGDGSLDFLVNVVRDGVPQPKQHPGPMPAFGPSLTEQQIRAVAAYVYARSHPEVGGTGS